MRHSLTLAVIAASALALGAAQAQPVTRTDLQQHDLSIPGREVLQARVTIAPGARAPRHWHHGEEIIYVLEGTLEYQIDGQAPVVLHAGDVLFVPARAVHTARNLGTGPGVELATYVVETGQPLVVMAEAP